MKEISLKASAKINLFLEVTGKLPNGYHTISTVMHEVGLWDEITIQKNTSKEITITSDSAAMPLDSRNIAYKAVEAFFKTAKINNPGINIHIKKNIPMEAGLAGGSADGAAVLKGLNELFYDPLSIKKLCETGAGIGADIPFCITGGAMLCEGIGDIMTPCDPLPDCIILIAKGTEGVSTPWAYRELDNIPNREIRENNMPKLLKKLNLKEICKGMYNCFEQLVPSVLPIKETMLRHKAVGSMMSGSGTAVFGIFDNTGSAEKAKQDLISCGFTAYICK